MDTNFRIYFKQHRASAWFLVSKFGPPAFSEPSRALRARDSLQPQEGEGREVGAAGEKKLSRFAVLPTCFCFNEDSKSAAGARYATFALFYLACEGGEG